MARHWAVLIDAENVSAEVAEPLFARLSKWGDVAVRRMYGDFDTNHKKWKLAAIQHCIEAVHLPEMVQGKNGADIALVIDAVDFMHRGHMDGFCLVSSDSDFTRLAWRLRADGKTVRGVGKAATAAAFRNACSDFIEVEALTGEADPHAVSGKVALQSAIPKITVRPAAVGLAPKEAVSVLESAMASLGAGKWHGLGGVGSALKKLDPDFCSSAYSGCSTLLSVVQECGAFEVRKNKKGGDEIARLR